MEIDSKEIFLAAIDEFVKEVGGQKKASELTGVPQSTLNGIVNRKVAPSFKNLMAFYDAAKDKDGSCNPFIRRIGYFSPPEEVRGSGLPTVPVFGSAGAGEPCEFWSQEPERRIEVLPQYAKPGCVALRVDGDSMEPTILKGSYVGVVPLNGSIDEGGIYLVHVAPFGRLIKRIRMGEGGSIELVSDNRKYPPRSLPMEQYDSVVIGKVVWVWQEL